MKKKIVIQVLDCDKCRSKAFQIAATVDGVESVAFGGKEKDQVMVIGDGVDAASLTRTLRKKVGFACLVSLEEVKPENSNKKKKEEDDKKKKEEGDKKENEKGKETEEGKQPTPSCCCQPPPPYYNYYYPQPQYCQVVYDSNPPPCTIM